MLDAAEELLVERGYAGVRLDSVTTHIGAGKAGLYRRWPHMAGLTADLATRRPLVVLADHGSLSRDVHAFTTALTRPLDPHERVVLAILGVVEPDVRAALRHVLGEAVPAELAELLARARARGETDLQAAPAVVVRVTRALVLERLVDGPLSADEATAVADTVLLPALSPSRG